ncbi:type IV pilus modification PilV family protein [Deinococcus alpinitundrae]|uniref:type IV pilus modification PilV family protein n=1 Tax=Deinococcus alpinitundrae TaxID=468913 RepID=UPI00137B5F16|nr:prepilin-type N-terminal cleavage/methylation domain-containing protein [Deinococcus alpinitundrae]
MKTDHGFTLIETLVAVALTGILIIIASYFSSSLLDTSKAKNATVAQTFSRSYLDVLRTKWSVPNQYLTTSLPNPTASALEVKPPDNYSYTTQVQNASGAVILNYTYSATTPPVPVYSPSNYKKVLLSVSTPNGQTLTFATQIINPPQ